MKRKSILVSHAALISILAGVMLAGCKGNQSTPVATGNGGIGSTYASPTLTTSYPGALNAASQLMLGTLRLEGTENTVTPEQAAALLPVAQALQGRVLQSDAERNAALAYIEAHLTPAQLAAIASMHLTQDDLAAWTPGNDRGPGTGPGQGGAGARGTPGAPAGSGGAFPSGRGTPPAMGTRQGQFGRGTPQARSVARGTGSGAVTGTGQDMILLNSLIRLLAQKAAGSAAPSPENRTSTRIPVPTSVLGLTATPGPASTSFPLPTPTKP